MSPRRRVVMRDVAERAGVSVATVSYVLGGRSGGDSRIPEETRGRVAAAAQELGYQPNYAARGLRKGRTEQVCVVARWPDSPWARGLAAGVGQAAQRAGYATLVFFQGDWVAYLSRRVADGAVVDLFGRDREAGVGLAELAAGGTVLTVLSGEIDPDGFDVVRTTEGEACLDAVQSLVGAGHRRIACLRRDPHDADNGYRNHRLEAYTTGLSQAGLDPRGLVRCVNGSWIQAYETTRELLHLDKPPTAIFAINESSCHAAMWAAASLGRRVPDDVAVVGVGIGLAESFPGPQPSAVIPERPDSHAEVADLLFSRLAEPTRSDRLITQRWQYVARETT